MNGETIAMEWKATVRCLFATLDELTGEMQLVRQSDGKVILSTWSPDAFMSGVSLLGDDSLVTWLGWTLMAVSQHHCVAFVASIFYSRV